MDKESNNGLGPLSYLPLETRRKIHDLLLFDTCTEQTKRRTIRESNNPDLHPTSKAVR